MRLTFSLFLFGWWLTRQRWTAQGGNLPTPSISVNPSNVVAVGENITINCKNKEDQTITFVFDLAKRIHNQMQTLITIVTDSNEATFLIVNAKKSDGGSYSCIYRYNMYSGWSQYSSFADIIVREQTYPSPSISVIPSGTVVLGENVTIQCSHEHDRAAEFSLIKIGALSPLQVQRTENKMAEFLIPNVQESDEGIYFCDYGFHQNSEDKYSNFSKRIYINITVGFSTILWASIAAGLFLLTLLLVLVLIFYRKKRKGFTIKERNTSAKMLSDPAIEEIPDEVSYAAINHNSLKTRSTNLPDIAPESCVYAAVSKNGTTES